MSIGEDTLDAFVMASTSIDGASLGSSGKYLGSGPVVGAMASPTGVRYHAHLPRSAALNGSDRERIPAL